MVTGVNCLYKVSMGRSGMFLSTKEDTTMDSSIMKNTHQLNPVLQFSQEKGLQLIKEQHQLH